MKKLVYTLLFASSFFFIGCEEYDQDILPIVGNYDASIIGLTGPFNMAISTIGRDDILIDALFDGLDFYVIEADIDDKQEWRKRIDISSQEIAPGIFIQGEGVYFDYTIQLDYTIDDGFGLTDYTLVGSQF